MPGDRRNILFQPLRHYTWEEGWKEYFPIVSRWLNGGYLNPNTD